MAICTFTKIVLDNRDIVRSLITTSLFEDERKKLKITSDTQIDTIIELIDKDNVALAGIEYTTAKIVKELYYWCRIVFFHQFSDAPEELYTIFERAINDDILDVDYLNSNPVVIKYFCEEDALYSDFSDDEEDDIEEDEMLAPEDIVEFIRDVFRKVYDIYSAPYVDVYYRQYVGV